MLSCYRAYISFSLLVKRFSTFRLSEYWDEQEILKVFSTGLQEVIRLCNLTQLIISLKQTINADMHSSLSLHSRAAILL